MVATEAIFTVNIRDRIGPAILVTLAELVYVAVVYFAKPT